MLCVGEGTLLDSDALAYGWRKGLVGKTSARPSSCGRRTSCAWRVMSVTLVHLRVALPGAVLGGAGAAVAAALAYLFLKGKKDKEDTDE